jgi:hypothetical protein
MPKSSWSAFRAVQLRTLVSLGWYNSVSIVLFIERNIVMLQYLLFSLTYNALQRKYTLSLLFVFIREVAALGVKLRI